MEQRKQLRARKDYLKKRFRMAISEDRFQVTMRSGVSGAVTGNSISNEENRHRTVTLTKHSKSKSDSKQAGGLSSSSNSNQTTESQSNVNESDTIDEYTISYNHQEGSAFSHERFALTGRRWPA